MNYKMGDLIFYRKGVANVPTVLQFLHAVPVRTAYLMS